MDFVQQMAMAMKDALGAPLAVLLLSLIPVAEARFAIPFGMSMGLSPLEAFGWAFLGSSLIAPILLIVFIPTINALSKTKAFAKLGKFLYDKFEKKSKSINVDPATPQQSGKRLTKNAVKKMGGVALFVGVPLPLTGVWTGSAVASILKIGFFKSVVGVILGNAVACGIITLISFLFADYVDQITLAFFIIALAVIAFIIIKFILYKPKTDDGSVNSPTENQNDDPSDGIK